MRSIKRIRIIYMILQILSWLMLFFYLPSKPNHSVGIGGEYYLIIFFEIYPLTCVFEGFISGILFKKIEVFIINSLLLLIIMEISVLLFTIWNKKFISPLMFLAIYVIGFVIGILVLKATTSLTRFIIKLINYEPHNS